jgi:hypothetical protein
MVPVSCNVLTFCFEPACMIKRRNFWITVSLLNLCIVALYGFSLRTKFLFPVSFIDYRNVLSAHSHFAFGGWVALSLMILFVYVLLPSAFSRRRVYQWIFAAIEITALGMAFTFPFQGYAAPSFTFSTLFLLAAFVFCWVFVNDIMLAKRHRVITILAIAALASFVLSTLGTLGITYVLLSKVPDSLLYRDSLYTFLHFQYNGFFTLSVFALLANELEKKLTPQLEKQLYRFTLFLCLSIPPSLFLSLLWHPHQPLFRVLAVAGCLLIVATLYFFFKLLPAVKESVRTFHPIAKAMFWMAMVSFLIKMLLQTGTLIPDLAHAIYGNRPVIIGFLHLVFLGLVTFYILSVYIQQNLFAMERSFVRAAFYVFAAGILLNELFLMTQGLGILLKSASFIFPWLLWGAAAVLLSGSILLAAARLTSKPVK